MKKFKHVAEQLGGQCKKKSKRYKHDCPRPIANSGEIMQKYVNGTLNDISTEEIIPKTMTT